VNPPPAVSSSLPKEITALRFESSKRRHRRRIDVQVRAITTHRRIDACQGSHMREGA
jgi:hypothetical protein